MPRQMAPGTNARDSPLWVHGGLVAVQLAFAGHAIAGKIVVRELPPGALSLVRTLAAGIILFAIHRLRGGALRVPPGDFARLAGCALLGIAANQILFFEGLARTTAINASVLVATIPIFTLLVALVLRKEETSGLALLGVALALGGVVYLLGAEALTVSAGTLLGDAFVVGNSLSYGAYLVLVGPLVKKHGSLKVVVWLFAFGALWVLPYGARDLYVHAPAIAPDTWLLILYIVLFATVFTYLVNAWALGRAPASIVAIYIYLQPVGAAVLAMIVLDEALTSRVILAAALVFAGIALATRARMRVMTVRPADR
jgi:drug/metabolite transporter (DMT)-like permease